MDQKRQDLSIGLQGDDVKLLHRQLSQLGFVIPEDERKASRFGEGTRRAVKIVQDTNWLTVTGVVDERTSQLLTALVSLSQLELSPRVDEPALDRSLKPIVAPINLNDSGDAVANLQEAIVYFLRCRLIRDEQDHPTLNELLQEVEAFKRESQNSKFGPATRQLISLFQRQQHLSQSLQGEVENETAARFNKLLKSMNALEIPDTSTLVLRGTVFSADGKPLRGAVVRAYDRDLRKQPLVGEAETDESGQYIIRYSSSQFAFGDSPSAKVPSLVVRAFRGAQELGSSVTRLDADREQVLDFREKLSEWETVSVAVMPLLKEQGENNQALPPWELNESDFTFLAEETGLEKEQIRLWTLSFILGRDTAQAMNVRVADDQPAVSKQAFPDRGIVDDQLAYSIFYGWMRLGLSRELTPLWETPTETLVATLKNAIDQLIVPSMISLDLENIRARIEQMRDRLGQQKTEPVKADLDQVLETIPGGLSIDSKARVTRVLDEKADPEVSIGERLRKAGLAEKDVAAVERTLAFQSFADNHLPLVRTLQNEANVNSLRDLALRVNKESLTGKIIYDRAFPDGENPQAYADRLYNKLFQAEPTAVLRNMLADPAATPVEDEAVRTDIAAFLSRLPDTFNIKTTSVYEAFRNENAFAGTAAENREQIKEELKSLQRVAAISPSPEVMPVLMRANLTSAFLISDLPEEQFVQTFSEQLGENGEVVARETHANATNARIRNEHALIALKEAKDGTGISMVDKSLGSHYGKTPDFTDALNQNNLSWDSLFGDSNFCECGECTSVYGAANYFVELLQYLRNNNLDPNAAGPLAIKLDPKGGIL